MEFAENNRISHRQLYRQMILGFLAPFWLCMSGRGKLNGVDAVIGTVIAVVLLCFYVVFLIRLAPAFEDLKKTAGAFMGRVTGAFFLLFILLAGGYLLALLQEVVPISLITGISGRWIAFWAILTCAVGAHKGMQRRGRIAEVSGGLLLAGILLMMVLCIPQGKAAYLEFFRGKNPLVGIWSGVCVFGSRAASVFAWKCREIWKRREVCDVWDHYSGWDSGRDGDSASGCSWLWESAGGKISGSAASGWCGSAGKCAGEI